MVRNRRADPPTMLHTLACDIAVATAAAVALAALAAVASAQSIPIKPGVILTFATQPIDSTQRFDFERELTVVSLTPDEWHLLDEATNTLKPSNKIGTIRVERTVSHREATLAREIWLGNISPDVDQHRGTSWLAASNVVMKQLRADGESDVTIGSSAFTGQGTLRRVEPGPPPIGAIGTGFGGITYDFWFLDDTSTAWIVKQTGITKWTNNSHPQDREGLQELVRVQWIDMNTNADIATTLAKPCRGPV